MTPKIAQLVADAKAASAPGASNNINGAILKLCEAVEILAEQCEGVPCSDGSAEGVKVKVKPNTKST